MDSDQPINWIERLGKWRSVLAGWQLGTRARRDPESNAVRDHREVTMALRAEVSALARLLIDRGTFSAEDFAAQVQDEARMLCEAYERRFPGFKATDDGMAVDVQIARDTTAGWRP